MTEESVALAREIRREEFAKAALAGILANPNRGAYHSMADFKKIAEDAWSAAGWCMLNKEARE